jgi:hypothetical protein
VLFHLVWPIHLLTNIRLAWKKFPRSNTLAYFWRRKKSFITLTLGRYIPVLMAQAKIYWDLEMYQQVNDQFIRLKRRERESEKHKRESVCVCVWEREREIERVCVCVCMCEWERERDTHKQTYKRKREK